MTLRAIAVPFFIFISIVRFSPLQAQEGKSERPDTDEIVVGVAGNEPFVFSQNSSTKGIAIEIWEAMAEKKSWDYTYKTFDNVEDALYALNKGELDIVVGPISITSQRLEYIRFSQPFYN